MLSEQVALAAHQARLHTQLQRAYDELRQTQIAIMQEERLRALGQMASGIAHDINNALCPIVVYADLPAFKRKESLPKEG
jgi:C4-dicarboxylate-specific signal transduction histidine kinase